MFASLINDVTADDPVFKFTKISLDESPTNNKPMIDLNAKPFLVIETEPITGVTLHETDCFLVHMPPKKNKHRRGGDFKE